MRQITNELLEDVTDYLDDEGTWDAQPTETGGIEVGIVSDQGHGHIITSDFDTLLSFLGLAETELEVSVQA